MKGTNILIGRLNWHFAGRSTVILPVAGLVLAGCVDGGGGLSPHHRVRRGGRRRVAGGRHPGYRGPPASRVRAPTPHTLTTLHSRTPPSATGRTFRGRLIASRCRFQREAG